MTFDHAPVLAQLVKQSLDRDGAQGGVDLVTLRAIVEEAGEHAATRALARLGLEDAAAAKDMAELRELLAAWRDAKKSAWKAIWKAGVGWLARMMLVLMLAGLAMKLGFGKMLK